MLTKPETVRIATVADEESIFWHLMGPMRDDNDLGLPVSPRSVYDTIHACCTGELSICGVIDGADGPVASIGIRGQYPWFSEEIILTQIWLFVIPEARSHARLGADLFKFANWHREDMSRRVGYNMSLENTVLSLHNLPLKRRFWGRYGREIGHVFWVRGDDEQEQQQIPEADVDHDTRQPSGVRRLQRPHSIG